MCGSPQVSISLSFFSQVAAGGNKASSASPSLSSLSLSSLSSSSTSSSSLSSFSRLPTWLASYLWNCVLVNTTDENNIQVTASQKKNVHFPRALSESVEGGFMLKAMSTTTTYRTIFTSCPKDWNETEQMDMMLSPSPSSLSSLPFKVERCLLRKAQIYINMH